MVKRKKTRRTRLTLRKIKAVPKGVFKLPIQTAIFVPSTTKINKRISASALVKRVRETRLFLSRLFGGYTSAKATGGFVSKKGRLIRERVVIVVAYAERLGFLQKKKRWMNWLRKKKRQWGQEAIGIIIENDMFFV